MSRAPCGSCAGAARSHQEALEEVAAARVADVVQLVHDEDAELGDAALGGQARDGSARLLDGAHGDTGGAKRRAAATRAVQDPEPLAAAPGPQPRPLNAEKVAIAGHLLADERDERLHNDCSFAVLKHRAQHRHLRQQRLASAGRRRYYH